MEEKREYYSFPGGVCPNCEHSPLNVKLYINSAGKATPSYYCPKCNRQSQLQKVENADKSGRNNSVQSKWMQRVMDRDGYACVICGSVNDLMAHHLISATDKPQWQDLLGNGITLCRRCHILLHDHTHPYPEKYKR